MQLTDTQKAALTAAGIDWAKLLQDFAQYAPQIIQIILAIVAGQQPSTAKQAAAGGCDHAACCQAALEASLQTTALIAQHLCQCHSDAAYG